MPFFCLLPYAEVQYVWHRADMYITMRANSHPDEGTRVLDLLSYEVLDSSPESLYDDIVLLASEICKTPIALISLVESSRQWHKASCGTVISQVSRDVSFCAHAILEEGLMVVEDATLDDRFKDNPMVTGDCGIRFYAGAPLYSPIGLPLGTLCVLDQEPRKLSELQMRSLVALSRQVVALLELRRMSRQLRALADSMSGRAAHSDFLAA